jgi:MFS transporter, Spinster family, sphingosine-1-phosphate transporter
MNRITYYQTWTNKKGLFMKCDKQKIHIIFTIFVFVALASLDNAVIGLFPPLFSSIARDLDINVSSLGVISAVNMLATSVSAVVWGYLADKGRRKLLIIIGTVIWSVSVYLTAHSSNYMQIMTYQVFTGIGLGCIGSIGFSVLTDYIPMKWRGMLMSLWGLSQGFGGIAGSVMASVIAPYTSWRKPFEIIAILGLAFIFLYFFIREPQKGAAEPELKALVNQGYEYNYAIEFDHIGELLSKKSNQWLILQGFFMNITTGTLIWLPTLYISKIEGQGYSPQTALITAGFLFALLQVGGMASIYFGYLGDTLQKKTYRGRALLAAFTNLAAIPLFILMFITPMKNLAIVDNGNPILIFPTLIKDILINPWMLLMFVLAVGATMAQSANTPNWLAIITDVNLPEHRATFFSFANLVNGLGRSLGNLLIGVILTFASGSMAEPYNYIFTMSLFQFFLLPAFFCYLRLSKNNGKDIRQVKSILKARAKRL